MLDKNGSTPLYLVFHPIEFKERLKFKDEKNIPKELLCWQDTDQSYKYQQQTYRH